MALILPSSGCQGHAVLRRVVFRAIARLDSENCEDPARSCYAGHGRICQMAEPLIRDISDTARWVAYYRARETDRPDAVFRDPYARALAGERGEQIAKALVIKGAEDWPWTARTVLFDCFVSRAVEGGADIVVNLAAGWVARPYRVAPPSS